MKSRRTFIKLWGAGALSAAFGSWSVQAGARPAPASIRIGHLADTYLGLADDPGESGYKDPGWLFGHANMLSQDIADQLLHAPPGVDLFAHSGKLASQRLDPDQKELVTKGWSEGLATSAFVATPGKYFSKRIKGFNLVALSESDSPLPVHARLEPRQEQLEWLMQILAKYRFTPTVLVMHAPLLDSPFGQGLASRDEKALVEVIRANPQVLAVLCGGLHANRAAFIAGTHALCIATSSPVLYPCGGRVIEIEAGAEGRVIIRSGFVQTRLQSLVEKSFHQLRPMFPLDRVGQRKDRSFTASSRSGKIEPRVHPLSPNLAPFWRDDSLTLAVLADTHVCLDRFVSDESREEYELIGHFAEKGGMEILDDLLDQVEAGRHRKEFFDQVFEKDPEKPGNFMDAPVDGVVVAGDLTEHGNEEESLLFRQRIEKLPRRLRERTLLAFGNHDLYSGHFSPRAEASGRDRITGFYKDYVSSDKKSDYVVQLTDWLYMIVLDTTMPTKNPLGMSQQRIDWLDDQLKALDSKAVMVVSHHPLYQLTLVPLLMLSYLRLRSHFTPKRSAARMQLQDIFQRHSNVKLVISGHYHGTAVDQFEKQAPAGDLPDDLYTTHIQAPCTIEYPNGYRVLRIERQGKSASIEYSCAYTRLSGLRRDSGSALLYKVLGTRPGPGWKYERALARLKEKENFSGEVARLDPYDLVDLNVRGFKDGTANLGRGNTQKRNIRGKIEFTI